MVIYLPGQPLDETPLLDELTSQTPASAAKVEDELVRTIRQIWLAVATVMLVVLMIFTSAYVRVSGVTRD